MLTRIKTINRFRVNIAALAAAAALVALSGGLAGCGAVVGAGAATGIAAYQERGIEGAARDLKMEVQIMDRWIKFDHTLPINIGVEVYEGRVLLTGAVSDPQVRADAVRLAWTAPGVKDVLNEIQITEGTGAMDLARDTWITTQLKSKLTFDEDIMAINYAIETVSGIIYLIGIAQSQEEVDRVIAHARDISYVQKIINHVRIKDPS